MKNIFIVIIAILGVVTFTKNDACALVVGDEIIIGESYTAIPFSRFQLGCEAEFVLDKRLERDTGGEMTLEGSRFLFKPTVSCFENLDIYAKVGVEKDTAENGNQDVKVESDVGPAYGGGLRANLISWDDIGLHIGLDAQYLRFSTGIDNVNISSTNYDSVSGDFTVDQWQVALFMVKEFFQATFYAGGVYADSILKYDYDTSGLKGNTRSENDNSLGAFGGMNIRITDNVIFFAEGHFIDEESIAAGVNARF